MAEKVKAHIYCVGNDIMFDGQKVGVMTTAEGTTLYKDVVEIINDKCADAYQQGYNDGYKDGQKDK